MAVSKCQMDRTSQIAISSQISNAISSGVYFKSACHVAVSAHKCIRRFGKRHSLLLRLPTAGRPPPKASRSILLKTLPWKKLFCAGICIRLFTGVPLSPAQLPASTTSQNALVTQPCLFLEPPLARRRPHLHLICSGTRKPSWRLSEMKWHC